MTDPLFLKRYKTQTQFFFFFFS
uniref:Uncharacterized protein n=1 Tax=Anguilla anguilla TaxID=7936 RepID=A0A0E9UBV5_ANGAN